MIEFVYLYAVFMHKHNATKHNKIDGEGVPNKQHNMLRSNLFLYIYLGIYLLITSF